MRREDDADARANLAIEGMALDAGEHAMLDMLREEAARSTATKPAYRSASSILRGPCSRRMKSARCARITSSCSSRDNGRSSPPSSNTMPIASSRAASRSEEHTSELQSLMRISYAVFCLKNKNQHKKNQEQP